jgi:SAM-dependent methyltransferase
MSSGYTLPREIPADMGGEGETFDERLAKVRELIEQAPLSSMKTVLDIGMGRGQLLKWLARKGKVCTGTGLELGSYHVEIEALKRDFGITCVECSVERMPFADACFDGVIMSHILEHCPNVGIALAEARRVLAPEGWLMLFVPPHETRVCAGHVSVGWSIGQLMYVLLLSGFDIKRGRFIQYGYNVCAFVQRREEALPPLRTDRGDILILQRAGLFPLPIQTDDGFNDGYFGDLIALNWDSNFTEQVLQKSKKTSPMKRVIRRLAWALPASLRLKAANKLLGAGTLLKEDLAAKVNPPILRG